MDISRIRALRGPNLWSRHTAIEAIVTCDEAERAITRLPGFEDRLRALFPGLGPLRRQPEQAALAHVLEIATLALQSQAGCPVTFSRTTETVEAGTYHGVFQYSEEAVGRKALAAAEALILAALAGGSFDVDGTVA